MFDLLGQCLFAQKFNLAPLDRSFKEGIYPILVDIGKPHNLHTECPIKNALRVTFC